jgi:DNA-binding transcriptional LysR family regulator
MDLLDAMTAFARVAETSSFTEAARVLGRPKTSVSLSVQRLEETLGTRLLHRTTRRVELTHDGRMLYERGMDLLADVDELRTLFRPADGGLQGRLRVDMPLAVARHIVLPALPGFLAEHPGLSVELGSTDRRVDPVREGFDCVLRVGPLEDSSLVARSLGHYPQINCASPAYVARFGRPRGLADLAQHRLVRYANSFGGPAGGFEVADPSAPQGLRCIEMPGAVTVNNSDAYVAACLAGLGIVQLPRVGVAALLRGGQLEEVLPDHRAPPMPVSLLVPHWRHLPRRVQVFMAWLAEQMAPHLTPVR